jgi:hypothetical protein
LQKLNKNVAIAIALIALMAIGSAISITPPAKAQDDTNVTAHGGTPDTSTIWSTANPGGNLINWTFNPVPYISVSPSPIGINQEILVNIWTTPPPAAQRYLAGLTVTFLKPDGTQQTVGPYHTYVADGTSWFTYKVDQVGNWSAKMTFPGQYFPAGYYLNGVINGSAISGVSAFGGNTPVKYEGQYYSPASTNWYNFTVQQDPVNSWYSALPSGYWTRPISLNNREWSALGGNYPWGDQYIGGSMNGKPNYLGPYLTSSNTAHVMWRRNDAFPVGIIGSEAGNLGNKGSATTPSVILEGRAYATQTVLWQNGSYLSCAVCYDIRTGEYYYQIPVAAPYNGITPTWIDYPVTGTTEVSGGGETLTLTPTLRTLSGTQLYTINARTGAITSNYTTLSGTYHNGYVISFQDLGATYAPNRYRIINWTVAGTNATYVNVVSNISSVFTGLSQVDWSTGICISQGRFVFGAVDGGRLIGYSLLTGQMLYNITLTETPFNAGTAVPDQGKYFCVMENGFVEAFDEATGKVIWRSPQTNYPWGEFWGYSQASAYGLFLAFGYDGVYAFDWNTGKIVWHFQAQAPAFETPYTMANGTSQYSFTGSPLIADGKLYIDNNEHTPSTPYTRGWSAWCVNMTDGSMIYKIDEPMVAGAMADGYTTYSDGYDGYMYVVGKGPSQTTVQAPQIAITAGQKAVITGTVTDQTPEQLGTPCISDKSMGAWMSYKYLQSPMPADLTGVPVSIDAIDPNGNAQHIGTVVSDGSGAYGCTWTPTVAGDYKVTATFAGSNAYGMSWAQTYATVSTAPASPTPIPTQAQNTNPPYEMYTIGTGIAIIIAIAIAVLILKKR